MELLGDSIQLRYCKAVPSCRAMHSSSTPCSQALPLQLLLLLLLLLLLHAHRMV
jgi:hypothetical protein